MSDFIVAIDQGTTGSTVLVVDFSKPTEPTVIGRHTEDFEQHFPKAGWVEHHLDQIWDSVLKAGEKAIAQAKTANHFSEDQIRAVGITNQRETLCPFYRKDGSPAAPAIVWQCRRTTEICQTLKKQGHEDKFKEKTGLVLDPYFSGTKLKWLLEEHDHLAKGSANGDVIFGTIDTYLLFKLTGNSVFATEPSNASRTLLFDIHKNQFDPELMETLGIPSRDILPEVKESAGVFGKTKGLPFLPDGIPISGILGDQQAALAGQTCFEAGEAKCTYGTGAFSIAKYGRKSSSVKPRHADDNRLVARWESHLRFRRSCFHRRRRCPIHPRSISVS